MTFLVAVHFFFRCSVCYEINHPDCAQKVVEGHVKGIINEDLPNSWECPSCCESGKNADYRVIKSKD
jgi:F-box and leucine-rich repeat protein 10/11